MTHLALYRFHIGPGLHQPSGVASPQHLPVQTRNPQSSSDVRPGELVWDDLKYISVADARAQWRKVKPERDDILSTKGGTTGMAKVVDFDKDVGVWVHIAVLKLRKEVVVPVWLEHMLNSRFCYQQSQELTFGIANRDPGLKRIPRIRIYLPPLPLQQKFAALLPRWGLELLDRESDGGVVCRQTLILVFPFNQPIFGE